MLSATDDTVFPLALADARDKITRLETYIADLEKLIEAQRKHIRDLERETHREG